MWVIFTKDVEKCFYFTRNTTSSFLDAYDGKSAEFTFLGVIWCKWSYNNKLPQLNTALFLYNYKYKNKQFCSQ